METETPTLLFEAPPAVNIDDDEAADSEVETEKPIPTGEYSDSPEDTDEEWHNWQKKDGRGRSFKGKSKADYDKPPCLWLMQTFTNGDEFKDQLLRYVLKTQYDVKLNKWQPTKYAVICTHEKCKWRIYCSLLGNGWSNYMRTIIIICQQEEQGCSSRELLHVCSKKRQDEDLK